MEATEIVLIVQDYGYIALFFVLWLGFFGLPVPNEVIVMTSGFIASRSYLQPLPAFLVTYAGVVCSLTTLYLLGKFFHERVSERIKKLKKVEYYMAKSSNLIAKHGLLSLIFSYFLPGIRHFVPFLAGNSSMSFQMFILAGYSTTFIWTAALFSSGYFFGQHIEEIVSIIYSYGIPLVIFILLTFLVYRRRSGKKVKKRGRQ